MAAVSAGQKGARVLLVEKNPRLGVKLLLTGGGRCNLTNQIIEPRDFVSCLGPNAKFLLPALHHFGVKETLDFFHAQGLKTKLEKNSRVFPVSDKATDVLEVFFKVLKKEQVEILTSAEVKKIITVKNKIEKIVLADGQEIIADNFILATGGQSYPQTGSNGAGYVWLKQLGHTVIAPAPSLAPLLLTADFLKDLEGLSVPEASLTLYKGVKKVVIVTGDVVFTSTGLSGPAALDLSRYIDLKETEDLKLALDFLPQLDGVILDKKLQAVMVGSKQIKNSLIGLVIPKFKPVLFKLSQIDPEKKSSELGRAQRQAIVKLLKNFQLKIKGLAGFDKAMITKGGVALQEIDPRTMRSKKISNLFICGEVLDLDGPTGGFNLQICWTTGFVAGESAVGLKVIS